MREETRKNWELFAHIATVVAVFISAFFLYQNIKTNEQEVESGRPYFVIESQYLNNFENPSMMYTNLKNIGKRPANHVNTSQIIINEFAPCSYKSFLDHEVPPNVIRPVYYYLESNYKLNSPFRIQIFYSDPLTHKDYNQSFYLQGFPQEIANNLPYNFRLLTPEQELIFNENVANSC